MRTVLIALAALWIGGAAGYFTHAWLDDARPGETVEHETVMHRDAVACTLSSEQIDHLSARIAPAVVERLGRAGVSAPDPQALALQRIEDEKLKKSQAAAYSEAARMMDQMIASRAVTPQGRERAHALLRDTGQADRIVEIDGRIAMAINRGELSAADAGLAPPVQ